MGNTYSDFKVDKLLGVCAHIVGEAELVLSNIIGREDKVSLALLLALNDDPASRAGDFIVDIERTAGLNLLGNWF